jgi:hypothetical protein
LAWAPAGLGSLARHEWSGRGRNFSTRTDFPFRLASRLSVIDLLVINPAFNKKWEKKIKYASKQHNPALNQTAITGAFSKSPAFMNFFELSGELRVETRRWLALR